MSKAERKYQSRAMKNELKITQEQIANSFKPKNSMIQSTRNKVKSRHNYSNKIKLHQIPCMKKQEVLFS
jgi:hypothetical protein